MIRPTLFFIALVFSIVGRSADLYITQISPDLRVEAVEATLTDVTDKTANVGIGLPLYLYEEGADAGCKVDGNGKLEMKISVKKSTGETTYTVTVEAKQSTPSVVATTSTFAKDGAARIAKGDGEVITKATYSVTNCHQDRDFLGKQLSLSTVQPTAGPSPGFISGAADQPIPIVGNSLTLNLLDNKTLVCGPSSSATGSRTAFLFFKDEMNKISSLMRAESAQFAEADLRSLAWRIVVYPHQFTITSVSGGLAFGVGKEYELNCSTKALTVKRVGSGRPVPRPREFVIEQPGGASRTIPCLASSSQSYCRLRLDFE